MNVLIDTCVIIDFLQKRAPFCDHARQLMILAGTDQIGGYVTAKSATDIYYLMHRYTHSDSESRSTLNRLLTIVGLLDSSAEDVFRAISSNLSDFEDAVMIETAVRSRMDCIVTRNTKDYTKSPLPVYTPEQLLDLFRDSEES